MATDRKRAKHTKVRTGCLTCKVRRKKCDETKPSCMRCMSTGRKCDGYLMFATAKVGVISQDGNQSFVVPLDLVASAHSTHAANITPVRNASVSMRKHDDEQSWLFQPQQQPPYNSTEFPLRRSPSTLVGISHISDLESHCLSYCHVFTVPRLTSYFEASIWRTDLVRNALAISHPVVFYAVAALGAVHRRFCYGISREAFEYCAHAAKLYSRATQALNMFKKSMAERSYSDCLVEGNLGFTDRHVVATSEMLLAIFQGFQAEHSASSKHLANGIGSLIHSPLRMFKSQTRYVSELWKPRTFCRMVYQLYCQATQLFNAPIHLVESLPFLPSRHYDLKIPAMFENLKQARDYLFTIIDNIWRTRPRLDQDLDTRWDAYEAHEKCLRAWTSACSTIVSRCEGSSQAWPKTAFNLLHITRSIAYLIINCNLEKVHDNTTLQPTPPLPIFPVDANCGDFSEAAASLISAIEQHRLHHASSTLRSAKMIAQDVLDKYELFHLNNQPTLEEMRHSSKLQQNSQDRLLQEQQEEIDGASEMLGLYSIAKHISEVEELTALQAVISVIPPHAKNPDIADIILEDRIISVRYHVPHADGVGFAWVEEWWSF